MAYLESSCWRLVTKLYYIKKMSPETYVHVFLFYRFYLIHVTLFNYIILKCCETMFIKIRLLMWILMLYSCHFSFWYYYYCYYMVWRRLCYVCVCVFLHFPTNFVFFVVHLMLLFGRWDRIISSSSGSSCLSSMFCVL